MYNSLKKVIKSIVPKQLLLRNELFLRRIISLRYKGGKHQCNICDFKLNHFVKLNATELLCPRCGSRSRTRQLYKILVGNNTLNGTVLHFSPPRSLYEKFKTLEHLNYFSSDFENEFVADYNYDIKSIGCEDNFFDLIVCYHILEHIDDDVTAMAELYRVLKPSGLCYIQTPFKDGDIYEDINIITKKDRKLAFGQEDHVRVYSLDGLEQRLKNSGFITFRRTFESDLYFGLEQEIVIIAKKQN